MNEKEKHNPMKDLEETFDVEPTPSVTDIEAVREDVIDIDLDDMSIEEDKQIKNKLQDSPYIRRQLKKGLDSAVNLMDEIGDEITATPSPKNIEAFARLVEATAKIAGQLTNLNAKERDNEIKLKEIGGKGTTVIENQNNNLFTTDDLIKKIVNAKNSAKVIEAKIIED